MSKEKKWTTVYVSQKVLDELNNLNITVWAIKLNSNNDKIAQLIFLYKESQK